MPKYRELVEEVITPKFAADFEKNAPLAEATVKQAGLARTAEVFSTGVSAIDSDSATALVAGSITQSYPKSPGSDERVRDRAGAVPRPGHAGQGQGHLAGRRLQPAHRHRRQRHGRHRHARAASPDRGGHAVTPTWYDLLGVEPDASADEIRAAWKAAIADLDPGDRRFRALNEAAEVLLDPDRRAEYDASLEPEADTSPRGTPADPSETVGASAASDDA